ncbi:hypothetical protein SAMN02745146_0203 [Hymenobacter daecheongensis DSM 21074]|uniref:Uncharacterized protein n=1 Tax=Hymenobacter daecheongensis DSM 21074 TaxID=1121955 RepID=A0A1M6M8Y7_9BACT|nr:hypothetical protein [Hymenobacter daecheongensis]SHJ79872.1 hypothetical protein SAMN02745146_0203 [Hymenobacter daecheongensis DSM 21074]
MEITPVPQPAAQPVVLAGPHLFNLSNVQMFYGGAGAALTVAAWWKKLPATVFLQVTQRGDALLATMVGVTAGGQVVTTPAYYLGPFRIEGTERVFSTVRELGEYLLAQRTAMVPTEDTATVLGLDGSLTEIRPSKGKTFKFDQLRPLIGADTLDIHYFQHGPLAGYILVIDDNGKYSGAALNLLATAAWFDTYPPEQYSPIDVVVGTVVLMKSEQLR